MQASQRPIDILLSGIKRYWFSTLMLFLLLFAGMTAAVLRADPMFEARALIVIGQRDLEPTEIPKQENAELVTTMAGIAQSDEVLRTTIERLGVAAFNFAETTNQPSLFLRARHLLYPNLHVPEVAATGVDAIINRIAPRTKVKVQPLSNLITVTYNDTDPVFAARFVNTLAQAFIDRQLELFSRSGASEFFAQQVQSFDTELQSRFAEYQAFAKRSGLHAVDEQRQLLLKRVFDASAAVNQTRTVIQDKQGQRQAITAQLRRLAPVARSPYVSSLVTAFGDNGEPQPARPQQERGVPEERVSDPPLLLVRAYQDSIITLFRVSAELVGLERVEQEQGEELKRLQADLLQLVNGEPEFEAHRRAIETAIKNKETFEARMIQERVLQEARNARFSSSVKIFQKAIASPNPVFPQYKILLPLLAALSLGLSLAVVFLRQSLFARRVRARAVFEGYPGSAQA